MRGTSAAAPAVPTGSRRAWMAVVLGSLTALAPLSMDMYLPALPALSRDFHAAASAAQLTLTACLIGMAVGQLFAGPISDARGRRAPLLVGMGAYVLASALCAVAPGLEALILLRFVQGLAGAAGIVIARAVARDHFSGHDLTKFFAMLMLVNGIAPIAAPVIGAELLRLMPWRGVFIVLAALGVLMWLGVALGLPESLPEAYRHTGGLRQTLQVMGRILRDRTFVGYVCAQAFVFAGMFTYIAGSPFVLQKLYGLSPQGFSAAFAVNSLGIMLFSQVGARLAIRHGEARVLRVGLTVVTAAGVLLFLASLTHAPLIALLVPLFFAIACVGLVSTTASSLALQNQAQAAGSASALIGTFQQLLGSIISPLSGIGGPVSAVPMGGVIGACDVVALLSYLLIVPRRERLRPPHEPLDE